MNPGPGDGPDARLPEPSRLMRNVVLHLTGEQPLLADIYGLPGRNDTCLLCTNLRAMSGTRPVFIDRSDSTFAIPLVHVRFIEVPAALLASEQTAAEGALAASAGGAAAGEDIDIDEDFLRRVREV